MKKRYCPTCQYKFSVFAKDEPLCPKCGNILTKMGKEFVKIKGVSVIDTKGFEVKLEPMV